MQKKTQIVLVDDHVLLRTGLSALVGSFHNCSVLFEANNGKDFIEKTKKDQLPDARYPLDFDVKCFGPRT